ncbi:unnamed protein product [Cylindrotheca closterium]|uniref:Poly [ADP-ribose] polymerase n=1 Tax=Cylindrotheca closterium TaxID=2856 RepID=A0AAD2CNR0_9STRA|nr:unnamed protein product [Cylindrotheca closterium]
MTLRRSTRQRNPTQKPAPAPAPAPARTKRKAAPKKKKAAPATKKKTKLTKLKSLKTKQAEFSLEDVVVDPQASLGHVVVCKTPDDDEVPTDAMLALVNPAKNSDKFYILQLVEEENVDNKFHLYMRWGRTGTSGQAQIEDFDDFDKAYAAFDEKFKAKTKLPWAERQEAAAQDETHYHFVGHNMFNMDEHYVSSAGQDNASEDNPKWQYWVGDGVDGKEDGWYDYDATGGAQVERLWREFQNLLASTQQQHEATYVAVRIVASGVWNYAVDLVNMTQTNVTHANHTQRFIRRFTGGDDNGPPAAVTSTAPVVPVTPSSSNTTTNLKTPPVTTSSSAAAVITPAQRNLFSTPKQSAGPPVDDLISVVGKNASDYTVVESGENPGTWYDVVLNQCNIGGNNNKYYRLQMLQEISTKQIYVWFRWGRVGEMPRSSTSTWLGPFDDEEGPAFKAFTKKYRDKTGNVFGATDFKPKKGKYTPIEVDHNVEVTDEALDAASAANQKNAVKTEEVEYLPSKLDNTTKDLIQTLFSKEMRNEALSSFQIDLKRLPLGVPSQAQIQSGIDVLTQIEEKLNDPSSQSDSFMELSSRFYTTIPHSFGRSRPPVIGDKESLQSRYDMCNILMDMYSTSETLRKIEAEEKKATAVKKVLPSPVDQHYESLHADLGLLDKMSKDFQVVNQYFEATKGSHSSAKLLNVWSVNRHQEDERFQEHDKLGNRCLFWHGTNIAVAAPILTSGLRIMPHSGGRVGAGIYLANLQEKSAQYTSGYGAKYACMFLCEAPLGKQHTVDQDGPHASGLKAAPAGFDSVHAVGRIQPKKFTNLKLDGKTVKVPCQEPQDGNKKSSFYHDELLVYKESQVRLRYVITVKL